MQELSRQERGCQAPEELTVTEEAAVSWRLSRWAAGQLACAFQSNDGNDGDVYVTVNSNTLLEIVPPGH